MATHIWENACLRRLQVIRRSADEKLKFNTYYGFGGIRNQVRVQNQPSMKMKNQMNLSNYMTIVTGKKFTISAMAMKNDDKGCGNPNVKGVQTLLPYEKTMSPPT